ncbi:MAG: hypothetical protein ABUT20_37345 [Bacteroidota bacterium]
MKEIVKKVNSFMVFDLPLRADYISTQFSNTHKKFQAEMPGWSTAATRQKLIFNYWFNEVAWHFSILFGVPALLVFLYGGLGQSTLYLPGILLAGLLSYPILYVFHYRPNFSSIFLPHLETIKESYDQKSSEQLEKCRKAQLSNFALTLIFYALDKSCGSNSLQCNDQSAKLMATLYGVDPGSLKKNLAIIFGKNKNLSIRKSTELSNQFEEAFNFLGQLNCIEGIQLLKILEKRLLS